MISDKLVDALNEQMNKEFYSAQLYLSMAAYASHQDLGGFANFFYHQAKEEQEHAYKIFHYIERQGGRVIVKGMPDPEIDFESPLGVFKAGLAHEQVVTASIHSLMDLSLSENDHATVSFLRWFVDEQVEEEDTFQSLIAKLERSGESGNALLMIDNVLSKRGNE